MSDFLKVAKKLPTEIVNVAGFEVEVRGLSIRLLTDAISDKASTADLIALCCFNKKDGSPLIPEGRSSEVLDIVPEHFRILSEAVARVNGLKTGNSNATDSGGSSLG